MKNTVVQLHNIDPEDFKNEILAGVQEKLESFKLSLIPKKEPELITRKKAAEILGVSLTTIHDWSSRNILTAYKIGSRIRFKKSEILETLKSQNSEQI